MSRRRHLFLGLGALLSPAFLLAGGSAAPAPGFAAPVLTEIDASAASVPIDPYLSFLLQGSEQDGVMQGVDFPIVSPLATGRLFGRSPRPVLDGRWMTQPIFMVRADARGVAWVTQWQAALRAAGAAGVVVAAASADDFKALQRAAGAVPVAPITSAWLAERLIAAGVEMVPAYIGLDGYANAAPLAVAQTEGTR